MWDSFEIGNATSVFVPGSIKLVFLFLIKIAMAAQSAALVAIPILTLDFIFFYLFYLLIRKAISSVCFVPGNMSKGSKVSRL